MPCTRAPETGFWSLGICAGGNARAEVAGGRGCPRRRSPDLVLSMHAHEFEIDEFEVGGCGAADAILKPGGCSKRPANEASSCSELLLAVRQKQISKSLA